MGAKTVVLPQDRDNPRGASTIRIALPFRFQWLDPGRGSLMAEDRVDEPRYMLTQPI